MDTKRRKTKRRNYKTANTTKRRKQNGERYKTANLQNSEYYKTANITKRRKMRFFHIYM